PLFDVRNKSPAACRRELYRSWLILRQAGDWIAGLRNIAQRVATFVSWETDWIQGGGGFERIRIVARSTAQCCNSDHIETEALIEASVSGRSPCRYATPAFTKYFSPDTPELSQYSPWVGSTRSNTIE